MSSQQIHTQDTKVPLISFIVPIFNVSEAMLTECIRSILKLELEPHEREIIVVDDGSEQSSSDLLSTLSNDIIYIHTANNGVSAARNTGLRMASGMYIQFVDGDDLLLTQPYGHVLKLVRRHHCDMVMFDFINTPHANETYKDKAFMTGDELMRNQNIHGSVWGYVFCHNILGTLQFTKGVAYGEDEEFTAQLLLRAESVYTTTAQAYYYREHAESAIHAHDDKSIKRRLDDNHGVIVRLSRLADSLPTDERIAMERRVAQLTMDYIYNIIMLTNNRQFLDGQLDALSREGLFPLPKNHYTRKYKWFRRMTNTEWGLSMLMRVLPLMKKER